VWLYLVAKPSHVGGRCGQASLPSASAIGPQLLDEGTTPSARRHIVLSLRWVVGPFWGCEAPRALIFDGKLTTRYLYY
jgi:hypothetical protein